MTNTVRLASPTPDQLGAPHDLATTQLAADGYRRLGVIAGIVASAGAVSIALWLVDFFLHHSTSLWDLGVDIVLLVGLAAVSIASRRSRFPARAYVAIALATEVLVSLVLGAGLMGWQYRVANGLLGMKPGDPPPFDLGAGEVPWAGFWVLLFASVVPLRPRQHLVGALLSVATLLLWPTLSVVAQGLPSGLSHRSELVLGVTIWLFARGLLAAGIAYFVARHVYGLRRQLAEARQIGSYQLREKLGEGGMGEVWRADHQMLARSAAIKLIKTELGRRPSDDSIRRFEREVQSAAQLRSPHTIEIYDYGLTEDGTLYYVMELLDGFDLEELVLQHGPLSWKRTAHVLIQACHSLAEAHERGLVHRDIKPANIYLCRMGRDVDQVKVLDFGLVKATVTSRADSHLTQEGTFVGTPAYAAPELATRGTDHANSRADLYSLGCVAYWLLTGKRVFEGETPVEMLILHARDEPPPPSSRSSQEIPRALDQIILDCLAKDPESRPASAEELSDRLVAVVGAVVWTRAEAIAWWEQHRPATDSELRGLSVEVATSDGW